MAAAWLKVVVFEADDFASFAVHDFTELVDMFFKENSRRRSLLPNQAVGWNAKKGLAIGRTTDEGHGIGFGLVIHGLLFLKAPFGEIRREDWRRLTTAGIGDANVHRDRRCVVARRGNA